MKWLLLPFVVLSIAILGIASLSGAEERDQVTEEAIKKAAEDAKRMGLEMPDLKALMDASDEEDKKADASVKETGKDKPAKEAKKTGTIALPDWTPAVPQFTPAGPVGKKVIDGDEKIVLTGTSPLSPIALADEWEKLWDKLGKDKVSLNRLSSNVNDTIRHTVTR
jgi:hypothetical protein